MFYFFILPILFCVVLFFFVLFVVVYFCVALLWIMYMNCSCLSKKEFFFKRWNSDIHFHPIGGISPIQSCVGPGWWGIPHLHTFKTIFYFLVIKKIRKKNYKIFYVSLQKNIFNMNKKAFIISAIFDLAIEKCEQIAREALLKYDYEQLLVQDILNQQLIENADDYTNEYTNSIYANGGNINTTAEGNDNANKYPYGGDISAEDLALMRALTTVYPNSDYLSAIDYKRNPISIAKAMLNWGVSNCMLTASEFYNPDRTISSIRTVLNDPKNAGFYLVNEDYAVPGSLVIASVPGVADNEKAPRHAMLLSGYADLDYDFPYYGKTYHIKKGEPLFNYSKGGNDSDQYVKNIPLSAYIDNSAGKYDIRYFRPYSDGFPAKLLPEVIVTPQGNQIGSVKLPQSKYYYPKLEIPANLNETKQKYINLNDATFMAPKYRK